MSQQNVDLVRSHYEAFTRGDVTAALQMMDEQIEFRVAENSVFYDGTPFIGREEVAEKIFRRLGTEWDGFSVKPEALYDAGNVVVMAGRYGGAYRATGRSTNAQVVHVWTIRNGKLAKFQQYVDTAEMRAVVGLPATQSATV
jgi:uncharacterized protein